MKKYYITLIVLLLAVVDLSASNNHISTEQSKNSGAANKASKNIKIHFRFDNYNLDPDYMDNGKSLQHLIQTIDSIGISKIDSVVIISQSSPEGVYEHNLRLSKNRSNTIRKYILNEYPELNSRLSVHKDGESWSELREYVVKDSLMKNSTIEKIISVIDANINIATKKWRMKQLPIYKYLLKTYYPLVRNTSLCILYTKELKIVAPVSGYTEPQSEVRVIKKAAPVLYTPAKLASTADDVKSWSPKLYIKSNSIGWAMGISNIAAEIDLAKHWSFTLPIYYSAWDYFKSTIKFRTFAVQPEIRYWLSENNNGFFAGTHFGLVQYNFTLNGDYRYQDHNRNTPAVGGGVSAGYRLPISKSNRWTLEFTLGAGVYPLHYDKFQNTPNTKDGLLIDSVKKTYWGIDQAAVSFSYSFDLKKKGGKR